MILAVLRPEPGNAATVARAQAAGFETIALPLFELRAVEWTPPDPDAFDALFLTSANTLRYGGEALAAYRHLPVHAVGENTAAAACAAGFRVVSTGSSDAAALAEQVTINRALHLTGRDHEPIAGAAATIVVYASEPIDVSAASLAPLLGNTALLHSARAAVHLGHLIDQNQIDRASISLGAFSHSIARAAGEGWRHVAVADAPTDAALFSAVDRSRRHADKDRDG